MELNACGAFLLGVPYQGKLHYSFAVKILTLGGECTALDLIAELGIEADSQDSSHTMLVDLAYLSQQLTIDGVPDAVLTPQFLLDNLSTDDYLLVKEAISTLRKKRFDAGERPNQAHSV